MVFSCSPRTEGTLTEVDRACLHNNPLTSLSRLTQLRRHFMLPHPCGLMADGGHGVTKKHPKQQQPPSRLSTDLFNFSC